MAQEGIDRVALDPCLVDQRGAHRDEPTAITAMRRRRGQQASAAAGRPPGRGEEGRAMVRREDDGRTSIAGSGPGAPDRATADVGVEDGLTGSATGSVMSSPSTRRCRARETVRRRPGALEQVAGGGRTRWVCSPWWRGARRSRGRSRDAPGERVTGSIIAASWPWSRKYSAIVVAGARPHADERGLVEGGGDHDDGDRDAEIRSMKSRTSRPRSPTSADDVDVGAVCRAICPSASSCPARAGENADALPAAAGHHASMVAHA